jgi:hypothetical protein
LSELGPEDRALFRAAKTTFEPTPSDRERMDRALGVGAAVGLAATTTETASAAVGSGAVPVLGNAVAWAVGVAVSALAVATVIVVVRSDRAGDASAGGPHLAAVPVPTAVSAPASPPATPVVVPPPVLATRAPAAAPPSPEVPHAAAGHHSVVETSAPAAHAAAASSVEQASPSVSVVEEARLLREAEAALRRGEIDTASTLLDTHARTFPHGVLVEEREAERVLVLCAGSRDGARPAAERFVHEHPDSPLAGRVRDACGVP